MRLSDHERPEASRPSSRGVVGVVSGMRVWVDHEPMMTRGLWPRQFVWSFRVHPSGGQAPVAVQMRGKALIGDLQDGDSVELPASWWPGRKLTQVRNLTTGEAVRVKAPSRIGNVFVVAVTLLVAAWIALLFGANINEVVR
jgi:hypothetical protein